MFVILEVSGCKYFSVLQTVNIHTMGKRKNKVAKTNFEHQIKQKRMDAKAKQLEAAVQYCIENGCRGRAAISANICPDIHDRRTIDRRLDQGIIIHGRNSLLVASLNLLILR